MGRKLSPKAVPYGHADGTTTFRVRLRVAGRQTTETFSSEVAANVFIAHMLDPAIGPERAVELRNREDSRSSSYVPTLREALAHHVEHLTGVYEATREEYRALAARTWLPVLGSLRVDDIARKDVARWVNAATGAPKTIRNAHSILSATLNTAVLDGHINANPCKGTRLPRTGEEDVEDIRFLTTAEFEILHAAIPEYYRPLSLWMFGTGMRFGEYTAQQRHDLDLAAGHVVDGAWTSAPTARVVRAWKKGGALGPPKSRAGRRTVVLPAELAETIDPLLEGLAMDGFVFRTPSGRPVTHSNFFNRIWKPATMRASICEDHRPAKCRCFAGKPFLCTVHTERDEKGHTVLPEPCGCPGTLPFRPRIHDARHTHASWLIARGIRLDVIQDRLGHEDYLTTQRLYGHLLPDARIEAGAAASLAFAQTSISTGALRLLPPGPEA